MTTRHLAIICGLFFSPLILFAQQNIKGKVSSSSGEPLPGVKIQVLETYLKTYSDAEGIFEFTNVPSGEYELLFQLVGFEDQTELVSVQGQDAEINVSMNENLQEIEEILVSAVKADDKTPTTYTNLDQKEIDRLNYGQDMPYILRNTPSTVVTSDAGAGVGYTGIRIRGVDPTRTNVTINGIPLNDSESHGVYWVDLPDMASSVNDIQVQRGVGTSANGAAAFGASININTNEIKKEAYGRIDNTYGSFNTVKNTVAAGTGLLNKHFTMDVRLSNLMSDGFIDRASSDMQSGYLSTAWVGTKSQLKANIFLGKEKTYQAWWGVPQVKYDGDEDALISHFYNNYYPGGLYQNANDSVNLFDSGDNTYNYYTYDNEVDNYQQNHYQLHFSHRFNKKLKLDAAGHYTRGFGYYEQYRIEDKFSTYSIAPLILSSDTITSGDFIRRRWLDNHFYGGIFSFNYNKQNTSLRFGGGANQYLGDHYGEIIWAEFASNSNIRDQYYQTDADKFEFQTYGKGTLKKNKATYFIDIQFRHIDYRFEGFDEVNGDIVFLDQQVSYDFINPKAGFMIDFNSKNNLYFSVAIANREPVRSDFVESTSNSRPEHEELLDAELGYRYRSSKLFANVNLYNMQYENQLILSGQINDVGAYTRTNVDGSYRRGIELEAGYMITKKLSVSGNLTLSQNKITSFYSYIDSYDASFNYLGQDSTEHTQTDLAFSPNIIGSLGLLYEPIEGLELGLISKYVGSQFLDNTSSEDRMLDAYFITNSTISYTIKDKLFKELTIGVLINNLFDVRYANNGYTWGYVYDSYRVNENFVYPQAGRNFLARLSIKL